MFKGHRVIVDLRDRQVSRVQWALKDHGDCPDQQALMVHPVLRGPSAQSDPKARLALREPLDRRGSWGPLDLRDPKGL